MTEPQRLTATRSDSAVRRLCTGCGATAPGLWPAGWIIQPVKAPGLGSVGERAYCPDCVTKGRPR